MKIVCISASQVPSNAANSIQAMKACQALAQIGHTVHLLVPGRVPHPWARLETHYGLTTAFEVTWLPAHLRLRRYDFSLAAVRRAHKLGAQALYVWPLQAAVLGVLRHLPVLLELHGVPGGMIGPALFRLFLALPGKKRLLPITRALAEIHREKYGALWESCDLVITPNGVDLERYQDLPDPEHARQTLGFAQKFTVGYSGHLYRGRGIGLMAQLAARHPEVQFLMVGGHSEDVLAWRDRLDREGIANVFLTGFIENQRLPLYQAAADTLLMPYGTAIAGSSGGDSAAYASPMKMFEYLACGRAIIASDLPVLREVLDETTALLCPPENVDAWDAALQALLSQPDRRIEMGRQARIRATAYTWTARAQKCLASLTL